MWSNPLPSKTTAPQVSAAEPSSEAGVTAHVITARYLTSQLQDRVLAPNIIVCLCIWFTKVCFGLQIKVQQFFFTRNFGIFQFCPNQNSGRERFQTNDNIMMFMMMYNNSNEVNRFIIFSIQRERPIVRLTTCRCQTHAHVHQSITCIVRQSPCRWWRPGVHL